MVKQIRSKNVLEIAEAEGITNGTRFDEMAHKHPDRTYNHLVRYLLGYGFMGGRLFPVCKLLGSNNNSKKHVTNECVFFDNIRRSTLEKIGEITGTGNLDDLQYWINVIYFGPYLSWNSTQITKLLGLLKRFVCRLYLDSPSDRLNTFNI